MAGVDAVTNVSGNAADLAAGFSSPNTLNRDTSRKLVLVSVAALLLINTYRHQRGEDSGSFYRRLWGTGVVGVFLSVAADFVPTIAGPFSVLVVLGSLTHGGDQALQSALGKLGNAVPTAPPGPSGPVGGPGVPSGVVGHPATATGR